MEHIIAYNPYKNGNKGSVSSQPLSVYDKTIAYPWMADLVAAIRGGNDELKKQLPFRCAHYYQFRDNRRSQKNAVPESFLFQTTIDVDDKEYVDKAIEKARELNCSDTIWNGALLHLEYSARKKLHIDIRMPVGISRRRSEPIARRWACPTTRAVSRQNACSSSPTRSRKSIARPIGTRCCHRKN